MRKSTHLFLPKNDQKNDDTDDDEQKFQKRHDQWVVIVDDEEAIRLSVGEFLYNKGFQVTACADADSMLNVLKDAKKEQNKKGKEPIQDNRLPDAIVSDVRMPTSSKNGYQLVDEIRADPQFDHIPVVLLTAKAMTQDRIQGYKAGADAVLPKPFDAEELLSMLDNLIARSQQWVGTMKNSRSGENDQATPQSESMPASSSSSSSSSLPPISELLALKEQLEEIKGIMKQNAAQTVEKTNVSLTESERQVLQLICDGWTYSEIAETRGGTVNAVSRTVQKLYDLTGTRTRTELVKWALRVGYVTS